MLHPVVRQKLQNDAERREPIRNAPISCTILHVDMDAFFAAVEERDNPSLRGKPVIIGGEKNTRGVVTTCNYVARKYGIHAGMSLYEAGRRCPHGIYLRTHGAKYTWVSLCLMELLRRFSPKVEPYSIDEAFLDATGCYHLWGTPSQYGMAVKEAIREHLDLTASVGIGPSKVIAKMASGLEKPDGLTVVPPEKIGEVFGNLPVKTIPGVGKATEESLHKLGVETIGQLSTVPVRLMRAALGINGEHLVKIAGGKSTERVVAMEERPDDKSMGHEHTFSSDVTDEQTLHGQLLHLCDKAARRMRKEHYLGNVLTLKLRRCDFLTRTHQNKLPHYTDDPQEIYLVARRLLHDLWTPGDAPIRLIGISVSGLFSPTPARGLQEDLFLDETGFRRNRLFQALDQIRDVYGENSLGFAAYIHSLR